MVCPVLKAATTYAKDPKVVTAAGVVIMSTFNKLEDVLKLPKEEIDHLGYDFLEDDRACFEAYGKCEGTVEECEAELKTCLQAL